jgi:RNA polymerase sigma-70 factor (ECF subfamily)
VNHPDLRDKCGPSRGAGREPDQTLARALASGDEHVFAELVQRWSGLMLRVALAQVGDRSAAEDVVQDAWLTVVRSIHRFEGRSALRTWVVGIVVNLGRARSRAERRANALGAADEPSVEPRRFLPADHPRWPHHWALEPVVWRTPEDALLDDEMRRVALGAIEDLPAAQREVIVLRDVEGLGAADVCDVLDLTDTHQRVLLHRARSRVRAALERYFAAQEQP